MIPELDLELIHYLFALHCEAQQASQLLNSSMSYSPFEYSSSADLLEIKWMGIFLKSELSQKSEFKSLYLPGQ